MSGRHQHPKRHSRLLISAVLVLGLGAISAAPAPRSAAGSESTPPPNSVAVGERVVAANALATARRAAAARASEAASAERRAAILAVPAPLPAVGTGLETGWRDYPDVVDMAMRLTAGGFPELPADSGTGHRIVYSNSQQRIWLVAADGFVLDSYLVSGRKGQPAAGSYTVYSKSKHTSAHLGITMRYMVRFAWGKVLSIGFHEIPRYANGQRMQTEAQLGTFQSAGCVRQDTVKARQLYYWAEVGTPVVVTP